MKTEKLTIDQQIADMKDKAIKFEIVTEDEAAEYLKNCTYYFRLKAYAKDFEKYRQPEKSNQYVNLDFAYLKELSILDMRLRNYIFLMSQDIEHYAKLSLVNDITRDPYEDGTSIIRKCFSEKELEEKLNNKATNSVCHDLIASRKDKWTVWSILEVLSFSETIKLYKTFYDEHKEYTNYKNELHSVRYLRNAAAHNNCLLNSLKRSYSMHTSGTQSAEVYECNKDILNYLNKNAFTTNRKSAEYERSRGEQPITPQTLKKLMENVFINDFVVLIYVYYSIVSSSELRKHRIQDLREFLFIRMNRNKEWFRNSYSITSFINLAQKILDFFDLSGI